MRATQILPVLAAALLIGGCGGKSDDSSMTPPAAMAPARGTLLTNPPMKLASYSASDLLSMLGVDSLGKELITLTYNPTCSIDVYQIQYETAGGQGESTTASGALMVPTGSDATCQGPRPVVLYAHGTSTDKAFNIANLTASDNSEGLIFAAVFAAQGYIVVAPNYAGYDASTLPYHPYLVADQQSKEMEDALTAAKSALPVATATTVTGNGKLFVTGYSQGGYVAMATHRLLQTGGTAAVTASAPMSGPYALSAFGDAIFQGEVPTSAPVNLTLLIDSYQHAYGNVYTNLTDAFESNYAPGIDSLLPSTSSLPDLVAQGKLPQSQLFNSTPPTPDYAAMTPATSPTNLAPIFAQGFGTSDLLTNQFRLNFLMDAAANPDGGFPTYTSGMPPAAPADGFRKDLMTNDLRTWSPTAPVLLCGGNEDPTVFFLNTQLMQRYWGMVAPSAPVTVVDIDSSGDPYSDLKAGFVAAATLVAANAVAGGATDGGANAVLQDYHAGLVPPFCLSAVKRFFDTM